MDRRGRESRTPRWPKSRWKSQNKVRPDPRLVVVQDMRELKLKPSHRDYIKILAKVERAHYDGTRYGRGGRNG